MCELSEPKEKDKIRTTPNFALAMLIVGFLGVVRGLHGLTSTEIIYEGGAHLDTGSFTVNH